MSRSKGGRKKVFYAESAVTQEERVKWAYSRWLSARARAQRTPHDRALALAADARRDEWRAAKDALTRTRERSNATERHAAHDDPSELLRSRAANG